MTLELKCIKNMKENLKKETKITSLDHFNVSMVDDEDFEELKKEIEEEGAQE